MPLVNLFIYMYRAVRAYRQSVSDKKDFEILVRDVVFKRNAGIKMAAVLS